MAGVREEEATGRLDNLLVRPLPRLVWFAGRLGVSLTLVVLAGLAAGVATWLGSANQHPGVSPLTLVGAGLNACAPAVCVLGVGALVLGLRPHSPSSAVTSNTPSS